MAEYEYTAPTTSPFYRGVVSPMCQWVVRRIPPSVSPDTITWVGLLFAAMAVLAVPASRLLAAVCWILYATADNLDGKHARATKQASVKGEFLDHVVDSATCSLLTIILAASTEGHYPPCAMLTLTVQVPFIIGCWYYYSTGRILLGCISKGDQGPWVTVDEINYIAVPLLIALQPLWSGCDVYGIKLGAIVQCLVALSCLVRGIDVVKDISKQVDFSSVPQTRIIMAITSYVGSVWAYGLTPLVVLPSFVWLCSCLIFTVCAGKCSKRKVVLDCQTNILYPAIMIILVGVSSQLRWGRSVFHIVSVLASSGVLALDLKCLK